MSHPSAARPVERSCMRNFDELRSGWQHDTFKAQQVVVSHGVNGTLLRKHALLLSQCYLLGGVNDAR